MTLSSQVRVHKTGKLVVNPDNYDITDMRSDDSTDDDARPKKTIPSWARSNYFSFLVIRKDVGITFGSYFERKPLVNVIILFYDEI